MRSISYSEEDMKELIKCPFCNKDHSIFEREEHILIISNGLGSKMCKFFCGQCLKDF